MAITKIQSNAFPASIDLSNIDLTIGAGEIVTANIADNNVTHAKLHTDMDLSGKTVTLPTIDSLNVAGQFLVSSTRAQHQTRITAPLITGLASSGYISIFGDADASDGLYVKDNGNVGIGTTSPAYTLTVSEDGNDNIEIGAGIIQRYNRGSSSYGSLTYYGAAHNIISLSNDIRLESRSSDTSFNSGVTAKIELDTVGTGYGQIRMSTGGGGGGMNTDALVVSPTGNVGIGTTSPTSKLDITGAGVGDTQIRLSTGSNTSSDATYSQEGGRLAFYQKQDGATYRRNLDISANGDNSWGGKIRFLTNPDSDGESVQRMLISEQGGVGIGNNNAYWPRGLDAYHSLGASSDGSTDNFLDMDTNRGVTQIGRKTIVTFSINFPNAESNKAYRFYFGNGDGYCNIYAQMKISGTYAYTNSMGYRIYEIVRMANSGSAIYQTRNDELHSGGSITGHIVSNGWGFHSASNRHYIELRHTNSNGNPYYVDFEFYGMTDRGHIKNMQVQKVGY